MRRSIEERLEALMGGSGWITVGPYSAADSVAVEEVICVRDKVTTAHVSAYVSGIAFDGYGASACTRDDTPNAETGRLLAVGRALEDLARQVKREGWSRVETHEEDQ